MTDIKTQTRTPKPTPPGYDWRNEPWVDDAKVRGLAYYIAHHVLTAYAAEDTDGDDDLVMLLLSPGMTERIWKGPVSHEIIDARVVCAAAMGIDRLIAEWMKRFGSIDAEGMPRRDDAPRADADGER